MPAAGGGSFNVNDYTSGGTTTPSGTAPTGGGGQSGPSLPSLGATGGRRRNTMNNMMSKQYFQEQAQYGQSLLNNLSQVSIPSAGLSAGQESAYYDALGGLYAGLQQQLTAYKQQRVGARADFRMQKANIRSSKISGLADAENAAIERGITGSSGDLQGRAGVRGAATADTLAAKNAMRDIFIQSRLGEQGAQIAYQQGKQGLELQRQAQLSEAELQRQQMVWQQESQMAQAEALRDMYRALARSYSGGGGNGPGGQGSFTYGGQTYTREQLINMLSGGNQNIYAAVTGFGKPLQ